MGNKVCVVVVVVVGGGGVCSICSENLDGSLFAHRKNFATARKLKF